MKVLVAVASKHGSTEEIARAVAEVLSERGLEATVRSPEEVDDVGGFDAVVLGSAVYAGRWMKEARELVERATEDFAARPLWLFSSGPIGDPPKPEEDPVDVAEIMEATEARDHRVFAGRLERAKLGFAEKAVVMALRAPDGDFRDWDEIRGWAGVIAETLTS